MARVLASLALLGAAAAAVGLAVAATIDGPPQAPSAAGPTATRSTEMALSGVYTSPPSRAEAFGAWRGDRDVDFVNAFTAYSWASMERPPLTGFVSMGLLPTSDQTATLPACAGGAYDAHFERAGRYLVDNGAGDSWVRLGWEFNHNHVVWSINPAGSRSGGEEQTGTYAACFRRAVTAMRSAAGQSFRFVFSPGNGTLETLPDPAAAYPGDTYVDAVLPDQYDKWWQHGGASDAERWAHLKSAGGRGIDFWFWFAKAHDKAFGFAEWGLWQAGGPQGGGGDNPAYIDHVAHYLAQARAQGVDTVELYFNARAADGDHLIWPEAQSRFPAAAARYRSLWSPPTG